MSEDTVKLIGECSKSNLPNYIERLILGVKRELADSLTDYDLTVVLLFGLMAETGFTPLGVDEVLTGPMSPYGSAYDSQKLKAIQKMPKNWRKPNGTSYTMKFILNNCQSSVCQLIASKLEASKLEASTDTNTIDDNLIVNLFADCSPTANVLHVQPSRYVACKNAQIPDMFDNLDELSLMFKNVVHPLRNTILEEYGKLNSSLVGIPTEVKLKIFQYLKVPEAWKALSETCMDFHILGNDQRLWKSYLVRDFGPFGNHKASIENLCASGKDVDWKTEYMGSHREYLSSRKRRRAASFKQAIARRAEQQRNRNVYQQRALLAGLSAGRWRIARRSMRLYEDPLRRPPFPENANLEYNWHEEDSDLGEWLLHHQYGRLEHEDRLARWNAPMDRLPSRHPSLEMVYFANKANPVEKAANDSGYESNDNEVEVSNIIYELLGDNESPSTKFERGTLKDAANRQRKSNVVESSGQCSNETFNYDSEAVGSTLDECKACTRIANGVKLPGIDDNDVRNHGPSSSLSGTLRDPVATTSNHAKIPESASTINIDNYAERNFGTALKDSRACTNIARKFRGKKIGEYQTIDLSSYLRDTKAYKNAAGKTVRTPGSIHKNNHLGFGPISTEALRAALASGSETKGESEMNVLEAKGEKASSSGIETCGNSNYSATNHANRIELEGTSGMNDCNMKGYEASTSRTSTPVNVLDNLLKPVGICGTHIYDFKSHKSTTRRTTATRGDLNTSRNDADKLEPGVTPVLLKREDLVVSAETVVAGEADAGLLLSRGREFGECDEMLPSEEVSGAREAFEGDFDDVSLLNNAGSAPDLVGVVHELDRNGDGDAEYHDGVVPNEYTYKEADSREPYV